MVEPKILLEGYYQEEDVFVTKIEHNLSLDKELLQEINKIWENKLKEARKQKINLYNGISYRLQSLIEREGKVYIELAEIEFKIRYGLKQILRRGELSPSLYPHGCFVGATVKTSDGKYIIIKLSGKSINQNNYDLISGVLENTVPFGKSFIFDLLYQECKEEAGILEDEISISMLRAIYQGRNANIGFYFELDLNIDSGQVKKRFQVVDDADISGFIMYTKKEYLRFLERHTANKQLIREIISAV